MAGLKVGQEKPPVAVEKDEAPLKPAKLKSPAEQPGAAKTGFVMREEPDPIMEALDEAIRKSPPLGPFALPKFKESVHLGSVRPMSKELEARAALSKEFNPAALNPGGEKPTQIETEHLKLFIGHPERVLATEAQAKRYLELMGGVKKGSYAEGWQYVAYTDPKGQTWYVIFEKSEARAADEVQALQK